MKSNTWLANPELGQPNNLVELQIKTRILMHKLPMFPSKLVRWHSRNPQTPTPSSPHECISAYIQIDGMQSEKTHNRTCLESNLNHRLTKIVDEVLGHLTDRQIYPPAFPPLWLLQRMRVHLVPFNSEKQCNRGVLTICDVQTSYLSMLHKAASAQTSEEL